MVSTNYFENELKIVLLTGPPGVGKTTMVDRLATTFLAKGLTVSGISTREVRESGNRIGFKIKDLATREEGWLARKDSSSGPKVGSYRIVSQDLERIGVNAIERATKQPTDIIIVDEIGPMEMTSSMFRRSLSRIFSGERPTIATVKLGSRYPEVEEVRGKSIQFGITTDNREAIYDRVVRHVDEWIKQKREAEAR